MLGSSFQVFKAILSRLPAAACGSAECRPAAGSSATARLGRGRLKASALSQVARVAAAALLLAATCSAQSYVISAFAGTSFVGDGGPATTAQVNSPSGVALDGAGNVYIADADNHRIRKVDTSGTITTIAGDGTLGFGGDGGPASAADLRFPSGVALDGAGNIYIADTNNHRIRSVDTSGTITTIAGDGTRGFGGDGGPASAAQLRFPSGVALDGAGNIYIADTDNHRIRRVDTSGTITTIAGDGTFGFGGDGGPASAARLNSPDGVAVDGAGNIYIADHGNNRIRRVDTSGTITTVAGDGTSGFGGDGGPATTAQLNFPRGVALDGAGNVYIADTDNHRIRRVDTSGTITTIAGDGTFGFGGDGGPATTAQLNFPRGVALDGAGNVYIADTDNHRIRRVDTSGTITTIAGDGTRGFGGDGGPASAAQLNSPRGVALDGAGNVYIADTDNHRIRRVDTSGTITTIAGDGTFGFGGDGGPASAAQLNSPRGVALDGAGNVYIADTSNHRIRKVDTSGTITTIAGDGTFGFGGDGGPASAAQLNFPRGVALDGAGNVYIADTSNHRIRKVDTSGTITTIAGDGTFGFGGDGGPASAAQLTFPEGVALDGAGNVYIADTSNHRIRKVDTSGTITTIAGDGTFGFGGDGGPATAARMNFPRGVAVGGAGNVYIADWRNNRVRLLTPVIAAPPEPPPPTPPPRLVVSPNTLSFDLQEGSEPASKPFTVRAINGKVRYSIRPPSSWLSASPAQGVSDGETDTILAIVNPQGLAPGAYSKKFFFRENGVRKRKLEVILNLSPAPLQPLPPPSVPENAVVNAASFIPFEDPGHAMAPGSVVAIFGSDFTDGEHFEAENIPLPFTLGGVSVTFNGLPAALYGVWPDQINAQLPWELIGSTSLQALNAQPADRQVTSRATLVVENANGSSDASAVEVNTFSPAIFTTSGTGTGQGTVFFANTLDLVARAGFSGNSRPARAEDLLTIYANGLGPVDPPIEDGHNSCGAAGDCLPNFSNLVLRSTTERPVITIGGVVVPDENVLFSGLSPLNVAVYQVDIRAPQGLPSGNAVPIIIGMGESESRGDVTIAIE